MLKPSKKALAYAMLLIIVANAFYVIGVNSNGSNPTVDQYLGIFNFPWFNASEGVDAPNYYRNGENLTEWIESITGQSDHGALTGLNDDDHSLYLLQDGSEGLTGDWDVGNYNLTGEYLWADEFYKTGVGNYSAWVESTSVWGGDIERTGYTRLIYKSGANYHLVNETGGTEDTDASLETVFELAWSNCPSGGVIYLYGPGETWIVDGQIDSQSDYVTIKSDWSLTLKAAANLDADMFEVTHDFTTFESLSFDGNGLNQGVGIWYNIHLDAAAHTGIYHCYFTDADYAGIRMSGSPFDIDIAECTFYKNQARSISSTGATHDVKVRGCLFNENSQGVASDPDIEVYSSGYYWTITNCLFNQSGYSSVYIVGSGANYPHDITVSNCVLNNNTDGGGMRVEHARRISFSNNDINSVTHYGYLLKNVQDITIDGGTVYDSTQWGLSVSVDEGITARGITITGVTFYDCSNMDWRGGIILVGADGWIEKVIIDGCTFYDDEDNDEFSSGVKLLYNVTDVTITDCDFDGMTTSGVQIYEDDTHGNRTIISNNRFQNMVYGILADDGDKVMVLGNYFNVTACGIEMNNENCTNWMVSLNDFEDSADDVLATTAVDPHWGDNVNASGTWIHDVEP